MLSDGQSDISKAICLKLRKWMQRRHSKQNVKIKIAEQANSEWLKRSGSRQSEYKHNGEKSFLQTFENNCEEDAPVYTQFRAHD